MTPLQKLSVKHAESVIERVKESMHQLSNKHGFVMELCMLKTLENNVMQDLREISDILNALGNEK